MATGVGTYSLGLGSALLGILSGIVATGFKAVRLSCICNQHVKASVKQKQSLQIKHYTVSG